MATDDRLEVRTRGELEAWLSGTDRTESIWLVRYKKHHPDHLSWDALVESLLAHGWIDSTARGLDEDRTMIRIAPRRAGSMWSARNKETVARLEAAGHMTEAGRAAVDRAKADGSWTILDDVEALVVPDDLADALATTGAAREHWDGFPDGAKKQLLWWVKSAKRPATRQRRIVTIVQEAAQGRRANGA